MNIKYDICCLFSLPALVLIRHFTTCISDDISYYEYKGETKTFRGSRSPSQCLSIISTFLKQDSGDDCYPKPCAIGSTYQPAVGADIFFATASFAAVATDLNATDASGRLDIDKLKKTAHTYCSKVNHVQRYPSYASCLIGLKGCEGGVML